jgi:hypothetical protein
VRTDAGQQPTAGIAHAQVAAVGHLLYSSKEALQRIHLFRGGGLLVQRSGDLLKPAQGCSTLRVSGQTATAGLQATGAAYQLRVLHSTAAHKDTMVVSVH